MYDEFLDGNIVIEEAISAFYENATEERLSAVLEAIRERMHEDGHFMIPVIVSEDGNEFAFRTVHAKDGNAWPVAFTSPAEYENWGQSFTLTTEMMNRIFEADGDVEYHVPDDTITPELLEDGSFLKRATEICNRNRTQLNLIKLAKILRDSWVWVPCTAVMSDADYEVLEKTVKDAEQNGGLDSLVGMTLTNRDNIRMIPDILQNGDDYFFPVFTAEEEMGEYGEHFSKIERHFLEAANLARNNEKKVKGIVINAFSEPFVVPIEMFDLIADIPSSFEDKAEPDNK